MSRRLKRKAKATKFKTRKAYLETIKPYKSRFELTTATSARDRGHKVEYETLTLEYTLPATKHKYTPDFVLENGIIIETKGELTLDMRKKMLAVQRDHPDKDIRFVFMNSYNTITKQSSITYGDWATKHGFTWAHKEIPEEWFHE